jgi:hypothetical protein
MAKPKTTITDQPEAIAAAPAPTAKLHDPDTEDAYAEYQRTGSAAALQKAADCALGFYLRGR